MTNPLHTGRRLYRRTGMFTVRDCAAWDVGTVQDRTLRPAHSTIPVLLISGGLDGITPPGNAALAQATLPNAVDPTLPRGRAQRAHPVRLRPRRRHRFPGRPVDLRTSPCAEFRCSS